MGEDNRIPVGKDPNAPYHAYGDESALPSLSIYGMALLPASRVQDAKQILVEEKRKAGIPAEAPLHCRRLLHAQARKGTPFESLSDDRARALTVGVARKASEAGCVCRYGVFKKPDQGVLLTDFAGKPLENKEKNLNAIAFWACVAPDFPKWSEVQMWVGRDATVVEWFGKRRQAHRGYTCFSDIGAPAGMVFEWLPHIAEGWNPPLMQLGDLYAYLAGRAEVRRGWGQNSWETRLLNEIRHRRNELPPFDQSAEWKTAKAP